MRLPSVTFPLVIGNFVSAWTRPPDGASTQRVPFGSSQLARAPVAKSAIACDRGGVLDNGVRWSAPPSDALSITYNRPSLLAATIRSLSLYRNATGVAVKASLPGVNQSFSFKVFGSSATTASE